MNVSCDHEKAKMIFDFNVRITATDAPVSIELNKELVEIEEGGEVM